MTWTALGLALGVVFALVVSIARSARRSGHMLSDAHWAELHERFARAIDTVEAAARTAAGDAVAQDAFVTSARLAIAVTMHQADERWVLHVSLSQPSSMIMNAVAQRVGFFLVTTLHRNKMQLDPFVTASGVHHLVFAWDGTPLVLDDLGTVMAHCRTRRRPLPFRTAAIEPISSSRP